jgi:hypothetical protein
MNEPDVSVIIVTFNSSRDITACLSSVHAQTQGVTFEVIVVDNASTDRTAGLVEREFPSVRLVRRATNAGFAAGVNEGIAKASGRAFFLLNPDAELLGDVVGPMLAYIDAHHDVGLLAPKLLDKDGGVQLSCRAFPGFSTAVFNRYSLLTRVLPGNAASRRYLMSDFDHSAIADVDWASGAAWLLPRSTVEAVGRLDEAYFWSIEDVDYCQRIHRAGLRVVYFPDARVRHRIGASSASAQSRAIVARHRGMWRYYAKYLRPASAIVRVPTDAAVIGGISLRCAAQLFVSFVMRRGQSRSISTGT